MKSILSIFQASLSALALVVFAFCVLLAPLASAQIEIRIDSKNDFYIQHESLPVTVSIRNLAGRDIFLSSEPDRPWLTFRMSKEDGRVIPQFDTLYSLEPLMLKAGESVKRTIDINRLFPMDVVGGYVVRADIYFTGTESYYGSNALKLMISPGRLVWQQIVGVPEGQPGAGERRRLTLYTHRTKDKVYMYMKIDNPDGDQIYTMMRLGRFASYSENVTVEFDGKNRVHVLHIGAPKSYIYTVFDLQGNRLESEVYLAGSSRPRLKMAGNKVSVVGGTLETASQSASALGVPKISDRPLGP